MSGSAVHERRKRVGQRAIDGVLLLDKPAGITSSAAVQTVRRLFSAAKAGHTGTLDPLATGLLPVCLGEAAKFSHVLLDADKTYGATVRLGMTTTTGDLEGEVTERKPVAVDRRKLESVLERYIGAIQQVPPMYSALKRGGQPLYKFARAGQVLPRVPREVIIRRLALTGFSGEELTISVTCSKGTYIRVLAEDVGNELGCGACLAALRREGVGDFSLSSGAVTFEQLEAVTGAARDALLLAPDAMVASLPRFDLDADEALRLRQGRPVERPGADAAGLARAYGPGRDFLGVVEVTGPGLMVARRLRSYAGIA
jgi:tRNA pseudouridine55 synthase